MGRKGNHQPRNRGHRNRLKNAIEKKPHALKRLYRWVLHWAQTRYGEPALFFIALIEASIFPIPPDVLLIALCLGKPKKSLRFAAICTVGSVLGALLGYAIGTWLWEGTRDLFIPLVFSQASFDKVMVLYQEYDFWIVFVAAFTIIPFKVITITAGVFGISFFPFVMASIIGRAGRFFLVAALLYGFGEKIARWIDRYFDWFALGFTLILIGGFAIFRFL